MTSQETEMELSESSEVSSSKAIIAAEKDSKEEKITENGEDASVLDKFWKAVKENPADFTGWTYLLQHVEQENQVDNAKEAFNSFLSRYPYCYGYWKKYTDFLKKHEDLEAAEEVFEKGVKAIPLSIDLWIHYINFTDTKYAGQTEHKAKLRELYERGVQAAGMDFRSDKLWEKYLEFEAANKDERTVTAIYDRVLNIPTQLYRSHFENFSKHIQEFHPKNLVSLDEFLRLRKEIAKTTAEGHQPEESVADVESSVTTAEDGNDDAPPGLEPEPKISASPAKTTVENDVPKTAEDESEVPLLRDKIIEIRRDVHKKNEIEVSKRWTFEERVRRPYFHVKPLERAQIKNWREYLDYEIKQGSHERVVVLFERCLIACALYEEFWLKYAEYMEDHSHDGVRSVFHRACQIHLPKKPNLHLAWSAFEEKQGNYEKSVAIFDQLEVNIPGLAMVGLRRISLERRQGNHDKVNTMYKDNIKQASSPQIKTFYSIKYARYLAKNACNIDGAKEVIHDALKEDEDNPKLLLQLIDIEFNMPVIEEKQLCDTFDLGINSTNLSLEHRLAFSQRKLEFLEDFGTEVARLNQAYDVHQKLLKDIQSKKRKSENLETEDHMASDVKKSKLADSEVADLYAGAQYGSNQQSTAATAGGDQSMVSSTTSTMATPDPSAYYNQYAAGYYNYHGYNYGNWGQQYYY